MFVETPPEVVSAAVSRLERLVEGPCVTCSSFQKLNFFPEPFPEPFFPELFFEARSFNQPLNKAPYR
jgi:hypothetical protein